VPVEGGFRGVALNMAARLCSKAAAGEVLVTRAVADLAADVSDFRFEERGAAELKGFEHPVELLQAVWLDGRRLAASAAPPAVLEAATEPALEPLPPELDPITPMVDRDHEMRWLRGTWRQARRRPPVATAARCDGCRGHRSPVRGSGCGGRAGGVDVASLRRGSQSRPRGGERMGPRRGKRRLTAAAEWLAEGRSNQAGELE